MQKNIIATVFGGTGFVGTQIVRELAKKGVTVKVVTRVPERAYFLKPCGSVGQIVPVACNYSDPASIAATVKGSDYVVNCVGALYERRRDKFGKIFVDVPQEIARACKIEGVRRFVHISALGVDKARSKYAAGKRGGEEAVLKSFPGATILRPSVIFGPGDGIFARFAEMAQYLPALPLIGGGKTKFQPVYVGDVADAVMAALTLPDVGDSDPRGKVYQLGGPEIVTFREIYERMFYHTGKRRMLITMPWGLAKLIAMFLSLLPKPLLTRDQVETLKTDNVVDHDTLTLSDLNVTPTGMSMILPSYLSQYRPGGRYAAAADKRRA